MRTRQSLYALATLAMTAAVLVACGEAGSSGTQAPDEEVTGAGCAPIAGEQLVVLEDDRHLQNVENIIPAINAEAATPPLIEALNTVSAALDTETLIELNATVDIDRTPAQTAAWEFAEARGLGDGLSGGSGTVTIGAADFSESQTLGFLYEYVLDAAGFDASVRSIGNRELYEPALESGEIQVVPEYVGTLTEFLNQRANGEDAEPLASPDLDETLAALTELGQRFGLVFGEPSEAANQNAFAVTEAFAQEHNVSTLSEFAEVCSGAATILGGPAECPRRPFCQPGLEETYGIEFGRFAQLDAGGPLTKTALRTGEITIGLVFSTDADLAA